MEWHGKVENVGGMKFGKIENPNKSRHCSQQPSAWRHRESNSGSQQVKTSGLTLVHRDGIFLLHHFNVFIFIDGDILHLRSETVTFCRWMNMVWMINDGHMIQGEECSLNFLTFVLQLQKTQGITSTRKLTEQGIEPGFAGREATMLPPGHTGGWDDFL